MRLLVLFAALAGLFAMHGMSDHGTMRHGAMESHDVAATADALDLAAMSHGIADGDHVAAAEVAGIASGAVVALDAAAEAGTIDAGLHAGMGLCLAILAGAAVLALRRLRTWSFPLTRSVGDAGRRVVPARARAPDPPDLNVLSIQRC